MDPNHLPSSPLQHRRVTSSHADSGPSDRPVTAESNKLSLAASSTGSSEAQLPATSYPTQWEAHEPEAAPSYPEDSYDDRPLWQNPAVAGPSSMPYIDATLTQPMAGSSRCPSPVPPPQPALLTSEPLNRSSSSSSSHTPPSSSIPSASSLSCLHASRPAAKRERAQSLPPFSPDLKRSKRKHDPQNPSQPWKWYLRSGKNSDRRVTRDKYKFQRAQEAAEGLRRELEAARPRVPTSVIVAGRQPPITSSTLKSLDATDILKNPQLRHDLLFDALAFRPVSTITMVSSLEDPSTDPALDPRAAATVSDMYWESINEEIVKGCRCPRWRVNGLEGRVDTASLLAKKREFGCVCGGWRHDLNEAAWLAWQERRWQTRLPEMVRTLREILLSLMGSTTPCPNHFAHSFSSEALAAHETSCPTLTHALVPELYDALDPEFITMRIRRGSFCLAIFKMVGDAMKVHCAPVRDAMVDDMVATAMNGSVAQGLRKCFDCVEIMKLDIANHQVHALRPYLWRSAAPFELAAFHNHLDTTGTTLATSSTRRWMRSSSLRLIKDLTPIQRSALKDQRGKFVFQAVVDGFIDLVCANWTEIPSVWPPATLRRVGPSPIGVALAEHPPSPAIEIPESFRLDVRRIKNFNADIIDLALTHMVLDEFVRIFKAHRPAGTSTSDVAALVKRDIEHYFDQRPAHLFNAAMEISDLGMRFAARIVDSAGPVPTSAELAQIESTAREFDAFLAASLHPDSPAYSTALRQVRTGIVKSLWNQLFLLPVAMGQLCIAANGSIELVTTTSAPRVAASARRAESAARVAHMMADEEVDLKANGLEHLVAEVKALAEKMSKIVGFNLNVFVDTYLEKGMVVGV